MFEQCYIGLIGFLNEEAEEICELIYFNNGFPYKGITKIKE